MGQSPPWWPAVASRGLGDPREPRRACLKATTAWVPVTESSERPSQATVQARGLGEGGRGRVMRPTALETSEQAVAWLPRGLMETEPGDGSSGQQVPGHQRCAERDSRQRGAGREHGPGSVTTAGTRAWPPCSWTSAPDERPGECFSLPICAGSPTPRAPHTAHEPHGSSCPSGCHCGHSGCPQLGDPHIHGGGGLQTPVPFLQKAENCPPEQNLLRTRTWAADPLPSQQYTRAHTAPKPEQGRRECCRSCHGGAPTAQAATPPRQT